MITIIGSGAGGGILAKELSQAKIPVTIIEKGPNVETEESFKFYDKYNSQIDLLTTTCLGGSTNVSMANMVKTLNKELSKHNIDLKKQYQYIENLINVHPMDDSHIGKATRLFLDAGEELGLETMKMPKAITEEKCIQCGKDALGCPVDAKWTSKEFINDAVANGAKLITQAEVLSILTDNNEVKGVQYEKDGEIFTMESSIVILAAGAINTPLLLRTVGISAGKRLFFDPFVTVGGVIRDIKLNHEVQMNGLIVGKNFILSPHFSSFIRNEIDDDSVVDEDIFSIMVKTPDEGKGYITSEGDVVKINTIKDIQFMVEGCATAGMILEEVGVDPKTIVSTVYRGAHPGGSAAIGEVVDVNLETSIRGLFVCDASVLPKSPGKPPILTILALSKRLAEYIEKDLL